MNRYLLLFLVSLGGGGVVCAQAPSAQGIDFFEKHVRPILVDHCYKCHSATSEKLKGGLYVDSKYGLLKGGKTGPAVVPGEPDKSLLIRAVRYKEEDLAMPPKEELSAEQVAALETWVKMGAPDPRDQATAKDAPLTVLSMADAKNFWSFRKPEAGKLPAGYAGSPIDHFVSEKLQAAGLTPAPPADKRTLIRRATFDLIGLPPAAEEVSGFEADQSPEAFEKLIDRLLASPQYGVRWARHWLDVARYADTKGYVFQEERRYPYAYTYRDWVVNALNADMPYDQFLMNQVAADRLVETANGRRGDAATEKGTGAISSSSNLAAMGFLTVGRRFLNVQADIIDDRIDVLMRGTMGLTVACARCHDHKFDPIPIADYYSLYGVFASSIEPSGNDLPMLAIEDKSPQRADFEKQLAEKNGAIEKYLQERFDAIVLPLRKAKSIEAYLLAAVKARGSSGADLDKIADESKLIRPVLKRWKTYLDQNAGNKASIFAAWQAVANLPESEFAAKAPARLKAMNLPPELQKLKDAPAKNLAEVAAVYGVAIETLLARGDTAIAKDGAFPPNLGRDAITQYFNRAERDKHANLQQKRDALMATHPGAPARAMVLKDAPSPVNQVVFKRGNPGMPGPVVPRQFLECVEGASRKPFGNGSGRLELAKAIASKDNPLTARVFVNRVWAQHFEKGLVRTPSDFGVRGERPTHPELLDDLAVRFMESGWSMKKLHKLIMLSQTYQRSSVASDAALAKDADNLLLSHQNRQRLDFEALRDALLAATGQLDPDIGGRPIDLIAQPFSRRRTLYGFVDRQNLPSMFRAFDFASPDQHAPMRFANTVPQQALFMMNSPFVVEQARLLAARATATAPEEKIVQMYRAALGRSPTAQEVRVGRAFVEGEEKAKEAPQAGSKPLNPWEKYAQVLLQTNEFVFVD